VACTYPVPIKEDPECTASACRSAEGYEIRISTPGGFYVGHLIWVLVTCNAEFYSSLPLNSDPTTLRFLLTEDEFGGVPGGLPVGAYYGSPGSQLPLARLLNCGTLTVSNPPACSP
jgi:hypothetical protein